MCEETPASPDLPTAQLADNPEPVDLNRCQALGT